MFSSPTAFITKCPPVSPASGEKGKKAEGCSSTFCGPRPNNAHVRSTLEVGEAARGCKVGGAHSVHFQPTIFSAYKGFTGRDITPSVHGPASPRPEHRTERTSFQDRGAGEPRTPQGPRAPWRVEHVPHKTAPRTTGRFYPSDTYVQTPRDSHWRNRLPGNVHPQFPEFNGRQKESYLLASW